MALQTRLPKNEMTALAAAFRGRIGFYVEDINTGESHEYLADQRSPTASVIKLPVMVELFRQIEEGKISLTERHTIGPDISWAFASGHLRMLKDKPELSVRDLCRLMIAVSDDMATDVLMELVGLPNVNATLAMLGIKHTSANMKMGPLHYHIVDMGGEPVNNENDLKAVERNKSGYRNYDAILYKDSPPNNIGSPRDMAKILRLIHEKKAVSAGASETMMDMLKSCQDRRMIPKHIAPDVEIAHKTGSAGRIKGDVAIVYLPSGPLIVTAFAYGRDDKADPQGTIARLGYLAVKAFAPDKIVE